jgi:hypothetical protein
MFMQAMKPLSEQEIAIAAAEIAVFRRLGLKAENMPSSREA